MVEEPGSPPAMTALLRRAEADPNVAGVMLTGSAARSGMATEHSDVDAYVFLYEPDPQWTTVHSTEIDIPVCTLDTLRRVPGPDDPDGWWERYAFAYTELLLDRTGGELARWIEAWGTLSGNESKQVLESQLDGYLNYVYRSLKSLRDGREFEARLDAAESLVWGLAVIFAFERRVRPYNKYLVWELRTHPLRRPEWSHDTLLPMLDAILASADASAQRTLLRSVETAAREVGLGGIVDGWGDELSLLHGE